MSTLSEVIEEALDARLPNCPPELRDRIVELALPGARKAVKQAVLDVVRDVDLQFAYQDVERYRAERQKRRDARQALRTAALKLRDLVDDDDDEYGAAALADRIAELGPSTVRPTPVQVAPAEEAG